MKPSVEAIASRKTIKPETLAEAVREDNFAVFVWALLAHPEQFEARSGAVRHLKPFELYRTRPCSPRRGTVRRLFCQPIFGGFADQRYVSLLVAGGADLNAVDARGNTPLHLAAQHRGAVATIKALLTAPKLGAGFANANREETCVYNKQPGAGHRAVDACASLRAHVRRLPFVSQHTSTSCKLALSG